ncbi:MAG: ribonuclease HII [Bacteroidetes bacterium]|nr:MAG: ribonuclease HII [Bacteroidota bacterium]
MPRLRRFLQKNRLEAGCDEAGRGCLAGPVFAAAVILKPGTRLPGLNDSKKLKESEREVLRELIERRAMAWAVGIVDHKEIDRINILNASILAMHNAVKQLIIKPDWLLIDGNRFHAYEGIPHTTVIQGDGKFASIAAASILAKTHRDAFMTALDSEYPMYNWQQNKGYPTVAHRDAIIVHGPCSYHRMSFRLYPHDE